MSNTESTAASLFCPHCNQVFIDTPETKKMTAEQRRAYAVGMCNCPDAQNEQKVNENNEFAAFVEGPLLAYAKGNNLQRVAVWAPNGNKGTVDKVKKTWRVDVTLQKVVD